MPTNGMKAQAFTMITAMTATITNGGSGYSTAPAVTFSGGICTSQPSATATISGGVVTGLTIANVNCLKIPTITIAPPSAGTQATATATGTALTSWLSGQTNV
jgi:hypothetical protein